MSSKGNYYVVVEFKDEECNGQLPLAIVPESWVFKEQSFFFCYWSKYQNQNKLNKLIIDQGEIDFELSQKCPINIKYKSRLYSQAVEKMKKLEDCSSVSQTDDETDAEIKLPNNKKRYIQKNRRNEEFNVESAESDESDELPAAPQPLKIPQQKNKPKETPSKQLKILRPIKNPNPISSNDSEQEL
ncbi:unnamed protein product [Ceutorhynchus assimilis]|uniref:Uncharacterized protein n=1 Tax=Ceutorhynchus assimilis TaxID=467358 RepID=A0A9N9QRR3_9CUCU|nr:unnamed protein product [Ceutorhynchus assimilis]